MQAKRGRPKNLERRQSILDAAVIKAGKNGYHGLVMADVARDCGISSSLLFRYFPNKDALLDGMRTRSEEHLKWFLVGIKHFARESRTCTDFLSGVGTLYAGFIHQMHDYYALWFLNKNLLSKHNSWLFSRLYPTLSHRLARMPDYRNEIAPEFVTRAFFDDIFHVVFLHERMGTGIPQGVSRDEYVRVASTSIGTFLATPKADTTRSGRRALATSLPGCDSGE